VSPDESPSNRLQEWVVGPEKRPGDEGREGGSPTGHRTLSLDLELLRGSFCSLEYSDCRGMKCVWGEMKTGMKSAEEKIIGAPCVGALENSLGAGESCAGFS
jgi:hypothetical protein